MSCSSQVEVDTVAAVTAVMEVTGATEAVVEADTRAEEVDTPQEVEEAVATTETGVLVVHQGLVFKIVMDLFKLNPEVVIVRHI